MAAVSWAIRPFGAVRYSVVTLALWSASTKAKLRVVRQAWPSTELPGAGTVSLPAVIAALAAAKNAAALHAPTCVKLVNWPSLSSPATQASLCRKKSGTAEAAGNANDPAGAAPAPLLTLPDEPAVSRLAGRLRGRLLRVEGSPGFGGVSVEGQIRRSGYRTDRVLTLLRR